MPAPGSKESHQPDFPHGLLGFRKDPGGEGFREPLIGIARRLAVLFRELRKAFHGVEFEGPGEACRSCEVRRILDRDARCGQMRGVRGRERDRKFASRGRHLIRVEEEEKILDRQMIAPPLGAPAFFACVDGRGDLPAPR